MWPGRTASLAISRGTTTIRLSTAYVHPHYHARFAVFQNSVTIDSTNEQDMHKPSVLLCQSAKFQDCTFYAVQETTGKKSNIYPLNHSITDNVNISGADRQPPLFQGNLDEPVLERLNQSRF